MVSFSIGNLVLISSEAVVQIILLCLAGVVMAQTGVITPPVRTALSKMVFYLLLPAITFVKVTPAVSADLLRQWWPIAANIVITVLGGLGLGWVLGHAVKTPRHLRRHVIVATGLGNVNQLPLMLVTSMCSDKGALFYSSMGDTCSDDGLAYTVVGMAVASIFHHAVSYHLLKPQPHLEPGYQENAALPESGCVKDIGSDLETLQSLEMAYAEAGMMRKFSERLSSQLEDSVPLETRRSSFKTALSSLSRRKSNINELMTRISLSSSASVKDRVADPPAGAALMGCRIGSAFEVEIKEESAEGHNGADSLAAKDLEAATGATEPPEQKPLSRFLAGLFCALGFLKMGFLKFSDIIPIPTIVSLIGLAIGCCPPIKNFLFGEHAPLAFATTALAVLAQAIIPVMSFTLGAVLYKGPGKAKIDKMTIAGVVGARMLLIPVLGSTMVLGSAKLGWWSTLNPMFVFVLLIQNTTPTAINIQSIATMHGNHEEEMATLIFWQYMVAIVMLPVFVTLYMYLIPHFGLAGVTQF